MFFNLSSKVSEVFLPTPKALDYVVRGGFCRLGYDLEDLASRRTGTGQRNSNILCLLTF